MYKGRGFEEGCGARWASEQGPHTRGFHRMHHGRRYCSEPRLFERGGLKFAILAHLKEKPRHGYDIIREMEEQSGGFYSPSPGAVYPTLQALEDQDFVTSTTQEGKKVYTITEAGLAYLEEHKERVESHRERWEARWGAGPQGEGRKAVSDLRETLQEVKQAVRNTAGDPARLKEIRTVLDEAVEKIREIVTR